MEAQIEQDRFTPGSPATAKSGRTRWIVVALLLPPPRSTISTGR
jgi:hypothetical protein